MNKRIRSLLFYLILAIVILLIANKKFNFISFNNDAPTQASGYGKSPAIPVSARIIRPKPLDDKLVITGALIANESVEISSEISGVIQEIYFKEGASVKEGELLLELNVDEQIAQLEKLKFAKKLRETSEFRQRQLLEKEAISQEEYDIALTELNTSGADIKVLDAQIAKSKIRAPFDGIIGLRYISVGAFINSNSRIASLININPIKIEFSIPGKYGAVVNPNDLIYFTTDASYNTYQGEVYAVEPQIDEATRTLRIRAVSDNVSGELLPGLFTRVEVILSHKDNALMVPSIAILNDLSGHKVFLQKNGKITEQFVITGTRTSTEIEILQGVNIGDTIITSGLLQIKPSSLVIISELN